MSLRVVIYAAKSTADTSRLDPRSDQGVRGARQGRRAGPWTAAPSPTKPHPPTRATGARLSNGRWNVRRRSPRRTGSAGLLVWHSNRIARGGGDSPDASRHLVEYLFWARRANVELHSVQDDTTFSNSILAVVMGEMAHQESKIKAANVAQGHGPTPGLAQAHWRRALRLRARPGTRACGPTRRPRLRCSASSVWSSVASRRPRSPESSTARAPPLRGQEWSQGSISQMIRRRTYLGQIRGDDGEWIEGLHEAIVTEDLFNAANRASTAAAASGGARAVRARRPGTCFPAACCGTPSADRP